MSSTNGSLGRKLRMALVGGGGAAFIGKVHASAAVRDGRAELVAGALSSNPERAKASASMFGISDERCYESYEQMLATEQALPADERIDFVSIATPNFLHFPVAKAALESGFHVLCDKPMTVNSEQAEQLVSLVEETGRVFALTHNYTGYPLIRHARQLIQDGELGTIQAVRVRYMQGWMRTIEFGAEMERGGWKFDAEKNGRAGTLGDVGTHAFNLARYLSGLKPQDLSCTLRQFLPNNPLDDYGHVLVRAEEGALIAISVSQVTHGRYNDLEIEIDGTDGALTWRQESPNQLTLRHNAKPIQIVERHPGADYINESGVAACRLPPGHPEGFIEGFANVYRSAYDDMIKVSAGEKVDLASAVYPTVRDGAEGIRFLERCLQSNDENGDWVSMD
jgi:predicted dehydrogenase